MKIRLSGYIEVPSDRLRAVRDALGEHIRLTRAEPGCVRFDVTPCTGGRFEVAELFVNRVAFEAHQARTAASDWAVVTAGLKRSYAIEELET